MSVQLFARLQDSTEYINIDLNTDEPIKMVLSVQNIEDPLAATSTFSRTFKVPHTGVNGPYFKGVFNVNSVDFDASKRADAYILDNGQFFANGQIVLNAIFRNEKERNVEYEITFLGETSDFGAKIGGGFMNQINMNHLNHAKSFDNITQSWYGNLFNGDIVYGLIEWGYTYNANNQPIQPTLSNGFAKSFTNTNNPLKLSQWKPQYRAKAIWDQIFKEAGYTYDSTFLESDLFKKLYIISDNVAAAELNTANTFDVSASFAGGSPTNSTFEVLYQTELSDPGNNFNLPASSYIAPVAGLYTFDWEATASLGDYYQQFASAVDCVVEFYTQNGTLAIIPFTAFNDGYDQWSQNTYQTYVSDTVQMQLQAGDVVRTRISVGPNQGFSSFDYLSLYGINWSCTDAPQILSASGILPANIKKIDFMKAIINRFRLVFVPSRDIQNHFTITPWKDWILEGTVKDWTNKLDDSKDLKIRPLFYGQNRFQIYKDQEDADFLNYNYQLTYKQTFGQLNFDSNNELITGSKEYKDQFAPTPISPIGFKDGDLPGSRFLIPHMAKDSGSTDDATGTNVITGKREPIQPKLRLVFYNGLIASPLTWYMASNETSTTQVVQNQYPLMSQYSQWPITPQTLDLSWKNEVPFWDITDSSLGNGNTTLTSYNVYWKTWNDQVFDPYSRIVEASVTLDYQDVLDLRFNDYVFIKDTWYVVNKIVDYVPGKITNCRVELVKLGNIGVVIPYVTPIVYKPVQLCYSNEVSACEVYCCNNQVTTSNTYYILDSIDFEDAESLFLDQNGTIPAPAGIYSDGIAINQYDANGLLIQTFDPSLCDCAAIVYDFSVIRVSNDPCLLCCNTITQTNTVVYGLNPSFELNQLLWLDAALTIPVPNGWYQLPPSGAVIQWTNGSAAQSYNCAACNCNVPTLYQHTVKYHPSIECRACRCGTTVTVWTDTANWNVATEVWSNNIGTVAAAVGFYNKNNFVLEVDAAGAVLSGEVCPTCPPCKTTVDIVATLQVGLVGYDSDILIEESDDSGQTWMQVGELEILPTDTVTTKTQTFQIGVGSIFKITSSSDTVAGVISSTLTVNSDVQPAKRADSPGFTLEMYDVQVIESDTFAFNMTVSGGTPIPRDVVAGGQFEFYKAEQVSTGILSLDANGDVTTPSFGTGFKRSGGTLPAIIYDIKRWNDKYVIGGQFDTYNDQAVTIGLIVLNEDGSIYAPFQTLKGAYIPTAGQPYITSVEIIGDVAYIGGNYLYWNEAALGSGDTNYYVDSRQMNAINLTDGSIDKTFNAKYSTTTFGLMRRILYRDSYLYCGSTLTFYDGIQAGRLVKLDLTGIRDTSFSTVTSLGTLTYLEIAEGDSYIYTSGGTTGDWTKTLRRLNISDGSLDSTFAVGTIDSNTIYMQLDGNILYATGTFTTYADPVQGTLPRRAVLAINVTNGLVLEGFNVGTGLTNPGTGDIVLVSGDDMYIGGDFLNYNAALASKLVKINKLTGVKDPDFATGGGFDNRVRAIITKNPDVNPSFDCNLKNLSYSSESGCEAYCNFQTTQSSYWIDSPDLITASLVLNNTQCGSGGNGNQPGWYSDGLVIVEVGAAGVIVATVNPGLCTCGPQDPLYPHSVQYDLDFCNSCCGFNTLPVTVWSSSRRFATSAILYEDSAGSTFAASGYYSDGTSVLNVAGNGVVIEASLCACDCPAQPCTVFRITNTGDQSINYSYTDCFNNFQFGTISPFASHITTCTEYNTIGVTGSFRIDEVALC